ncbi:MAG: hypothetical protein IT453_21235 [Planctomycetes bacterium]|nr:hypothetical protein [Planctomycetota bacterium]
MRIEFKKAADGRHVVACERANGTQTWSRVQAAIVSHDFVHWALETTLGLRRGFWGLVASGWNLTAFVEPGATKLLPEEAAWTEFAVAAIWRDSWGQAPLDADGVIEELALRAEMHGWKTQRSISEADLARIRTCIAELNARWLAVEPGGSLALVFDEQDPTRSSFA